MNTYGVVLAVGPTEKVREQGRNGGKGDGIGIRRKNTNVGDDLMERTFRIACAVPG